MDCGCGDSDCCCEKFDDWELIRLGSCCIIFTCTGAICTSNAESFDILRTRTPARLFNCKISKKFCVRSCSVSW